MNKIASTGLLLATSLMSPHSHAAADIWACQDVASTGFEWKNGRWVETSYAPQRLLIRIDGEHSQISRVGGATFSMSCATYSGDSVRCNDDTGGTVYLNTLTGQGGKSELLGSVGGSSYRDSVTVTVFQCQKF
jgi:hypothetical protein